MRMLLTLFALLGTTATTMAQTPEVVAEIESMLQSQRKSVDVEVLRRLLNRQFGFADKTELTLPPSQPYIGATTWNPNVIVGGGDRVSLNRTYTTAILTGHQLSQPIGPFDGTVLPGGGIVYTLRIPAAADLTFDPKTNAIGFGNTCGKCHSDVTADVPNHQFSHKGQAVAVACNKCHEGGVSAAETKSVEPRSDWERVKLEVSVEKIEASEKPQPKPKAPRSAMCRPGDIAEQIVHVLAANAKNLGQLGKTDRVTVVVTFDELPGQIKVGATPSVKPEFTPDEWQSLNLGVLHLKQLKYKEAAEAFEKVLAKRQATVIRVAPGKLDEPFRNGVEAMVESIRGVHTSLAVAYANLNDLKKAKRSLDLAINFKIEINSSETELPRPKLPAKMIVSITKADIDAAKSAEDFRKASTVERSGFPALKK